MNGLAAARPGRVVCFGEVLLRLSVPTGVALEAASNLRVDIAGAEANVAVALAALGEEAAFVSRVPDDARGRAVVAYLRSRRVDVAGVALVPDTRMGLYFFEPGCDPRPGVVVYDRGGSAFATSSAGTFVFDVLRGASLLHVSGIATAVGPGPAAAVAAALDAAEVADVAVSFDLNYRASLGAPSDWAERFWPVAQRAAVVFVNHRDASVVLGLGGSAADQAVALRERLPHAVCVVTDGVNGATAMDTIVHAADAVPCDIVDRIGRGDAFCAGFLWGWRRGGTDHGLACGVALASLQQTYAGDQSYTGAAELLACLGGERSLRR